MRTLIIKKDPTKGDWKYVTDWKAHVLRELIKPKYELRKVRVSKGETGRKRTYVTIRLITKAD